MVGLSQMLLVEELMLGRLRTKHACKVVSLLLKAKARHHFLLKDYLKDYAL